MKTYIALLRGINVGGKGTLPMKELVAILESLGCRNVQTYIQSGNAVFEHTATDAAKLAGKTRAKRSQKTRGFAPQVLMLEAKEFAKVVDSESVSRSGSGAEVAASSGSWTAKPAKANLEALDTPAGARPSDSNCARPCSISTPPTASAARNSPRTSNGIWASHHGRNWRTVCKLLEIANADA